MEGVIFKYLPVDLIFEALSVRGRRKACHLQDDPYRRKEKMQKEGFQISAPWMGPIWGGFKSSHLNFPWDLGNLNDLLKRN